MWQTTRKPNDWPLVDRLLRDEPLFTIAGFFLVLIALPTLLLIAVDTRTFQGQSVWLKPLKFELSIAMFLLTLAFYARYLPEGMTARTDYKIYSAIVVGCAIMEMIWIAGAASFATASHFNTNPTMARIYGLMGLIAVVLTSASLVYGIAILRSGNRSPLTTAIGIGLILTFALTIIVAFKLAGNGGHFVGEISAGQTVPLLKWSQEVGDLRVPHFFATHAMHFIPVAALAVFAIATRLFAHGTIIGLSIVYAMFTLVTFAQALSGRPFFTL